MLEENSDPFIQKVYGCIFCLTGKELFVAWQISKSYPFLRATAVKQVKRMTLKGETRLEECIVFPGYVFIEVDDGEMTLPHFSVDGVIKLLKTPQGDWRLSGTDEAFTRWVFSYDGVMPLSKAYQEGDRIKIIDGPLKDLEGQITRVDKRNKSGQVTLSFNGKEVRVWLGFELIGDNK